MMRVALVASLAERQQAEQRFRWLFDSAPDAMIAVASDGSIAMANTQAVRLFGYPAPDLVGSPVEMLVPEVERAAMAAERTSYFADPAARPIDAGLQLTGLRRDGRQFPAEISLSGLPTEGGMLVTAAIRDVSERLALEEERERLRSEAERERTERRLQQSQRLESLGQLVGGVAHDFNNLLNVIQGYADFTAEQVQPLAETEPRLEPVLSDIEQVQVAAGQAARLTRQLLTFARHEVNRPEVIDLNEAVNGAGAAPAPHPGRAHRPGDHGRSGPVPGQGGPWPARAGPGEPGGERARRDAGRWPPDHRNGQRGGRRRLRGRPPRPETGTLRPAARLRLGRRHGPRHREPGLRAVLHDQAQGARYGARSRDRLRRREEGGGQHRHLLRARPGYLGQRPAAGHR